MTSNTIRTLIGFVRSVLERRTPLKPNAKILLVEDNAINQQVAAGILHSSGYHTEIAGNGEEAIRMLQQAPEDAQYELIFMDCQMPIMDGYEATRAIRDKTTDIPNHDIPIIAMTANAMKGDMENCIKAGMDDYLSKPIDPASVEEKLSKWLVINTTQEKN